jgi:isopropylmalate/homocitrate/citramalate synthase
LLCQFFIKVLENSGRDLNVAEIMRFIRGLTPDASDMKLEVLAAIISSAGEAFSETAQRALEVIDKLEGANPGHFSDVIEQLLAVLPVHVSSFD